MFRAMCRASFGVGVTKARAISGVCNYIIEDSVYDELEDINQIKFEIIEFDEAVFSSDDNNVLNIDDKWVESESEVFIGPDGIERFSNLHKAIEREMRIAECEDDWRIDYDDDDITYVTKSEEGAVVSIDEHWDQAKKSREKANNWNDGETYWIEEVEGDVVDHLTFVPVD